MTLPADARRRLAEPLVDALAENVDHGQWHTVPVAPTIWNAYSDRLFAVVEANFGAVTSAPTDSDDYSALTPTPAPFSTLTTASCSASPPLACSSRSIPTQQRTSARTRVPR